MENNKEAWNELYERIKEYMLAAEKQCDVFEEYPPEDRVVDDIFIETLQAYVV